MGTESALVFSTGHQANLGVLGTLLGPGDTVIVDSADHASILDGCLLSRAKLRPFRHNRLEKLEKMLERAAGRRRRRDGRRRRRLLDGGRPRAAARDLRAVRALRRAADGRRGARRRRARRARGGRERTARAWPTAWTCGSARSPSRSPRAAASWPGPRRSSTTCGSPRARSCSRPRPCRRRSAPRSRPCACCAPTTGRRCWRPCSPGPSGCATASKRSASPSSARRRFPLEPGVQLHAPGVREQDDGRRTIVTPIVPLLVGDDWKAARALEGPL